MNYIPHTDEDIQLMLDVVGISKPEELYGDIPTSVRLNRPLDLPLPLDEIGVRRHLQELAGLNRSMDDLTCFLGAGIYDHFNPAVVDSIISRGEFTTAYTPYQPELSQGMLQALYEYQSLICALTRMDMSNASMYDGATALAEAALTSLSATGGDTVVVSSAVHPHYRHVLRTYLEASSYKLREVPAIKGVTELEDIDTALNKNSACMILQSPNFFGLIEDMGEITHFVHDKGLMMVVDVDPISLGLLKPPGDYGVDFVVGEGQALGGNMGYGGPLLGIFAFKSEHQRRFPGRIVGVAKDNEGRIGYTMTLRTREQDIRREKATSNICTNESLLAVAAAVYLTALGGHGLRQVAENCVHKSHYAAERLSELPGVTFPFTGNFFKEFVIRLPDRLSPEQLNHRLLKDGIMGGYDLGGNYRNLKGCMLMCVTEKRSKEEIDLMVKSVSEALESAQ